MLGAPGRASGSEPRNLLRFQCAAASSAISRTRKVALDYSQIPIFHCTTMLGDQTSTKSVAWRQLEPPDVALTQFTFRTDGLLLFRLNRQDPRTCCAAKRRTWNSITTGAKPNTPRRRLIDLRRTKCLTPTGSHRGLGILKAPSTNKFGGEQDCAQIRRGRAELPPGNTVLLSCSYKQGRGLVPFSKFSLAQRPWGVCLLMVICQVPLNPWFEDAIDQLWQQRLGGGKVGHKCEGGCLEVRRLRKFCWRCAEATPIPYCHWARLSFRNPLIFLLLVLEGPVLLLDASWMGTQRQPTGRYKNCSDMRFIMSAVW